MKYGTRNLLVIIARSRRKTLQIEVHPDMTIKVIAPENAVISDIEQKILKRGRWILKQQAFFEQFLPRTPQREYVPGETHLYLGKKYLLKIRQSNKSEIKLIGGELIVTLNDPHNKEHIKQLLIGWYFEHAQKKIINVIDEILAKLNGYSTLQPEVSIKRMPKRWGSCTSKGKITLNPEIIKAPTKCIEYVVIHELCHLIYHNHGRAFYQLQRQIMPDWAKWKNRLEVLTA